jgi:hypothetical protein
MGSFRAKEEALPGNRLRLTECRIELNPQEEIMTREQRASFDLEKHWKWVLDTCKMHRFEELMQGAQFGSLQQALEDAQKQMRERYGDKIIFEEAGAGSNPASWGFQVKDALGKRLTFFVVFDAGKIFTWKQVGE